MKSIIFNQHQVNYALKNEEGMFRVVDKTKYSANESAPFNVGQEIFVKEVWSFSDSPWNDKTIFYRASNSDFIQHTFSVSKREKKWRSPITMHEEYSRLTLKIKSVKVERLQDIKKDGAKKEGFAKTFEAFPRANVIDETTSAYGNFIKFWNSTHKKPEEKWEANPWVFVYEYEVVK